MKQNEAEWIRILDNLNGEKVLIRGNHDLRNVTQELSSRFREITLLKEIIDLERHIIMCHYPILFYRSSYAENNWHFCGHTHNHTKEEMYRREFVQQMVDDYQGEGCNRGHIINVGCMMDYMAYMPRTASELISWWKNEYETKG